MAFDNLEDFNNAINNYTKVLLPAQFIEYFRSIGVALLAAIISKTPVGNKKRWKKPQYAPPGYVGGRARGNWQVSINGSGENALDVIDPNGRATLDVGTSKMVNLKIGDTINIYNNLPYILRLENEAWSTVAPNGMVAVSFEEIIMRFSG